jgi:hypothetical protein
MIVDVLHYELITAVDCVLLIASNLVKIISFLSFANVHVTDM